MTLRQLEYLIAVAEQGSFTRAAKALFVSQPALSHQLRTLEDELGVELLERIPEGARPTPVGEAFLEHARLTVERAARATEAARQAASLDAGEVRLGTLYSLALGVIPAVLGAWRRSHPAVPADVSEYPNIDALVEAMADGAVDVGVGPVPDPGWDGPIRPLGAEELCVVLPDGDPLLETHPETVPLTALADRAWVLYVADSGLSRVVEAACDEAGFTPRGAARTHHTTTAVELAAAGLGPALVPRNVIATAFAANTRHAEPRVRRELCAFTREEASPPVNAFVDVLVAHATVV